MLQLVLIIDSREQYSHVSKSKAEGLSRHVQLVRDRNIPVEVRGLQQGDALWIAKSRSCSPPCHSSISFVDPFKIMSAW